jgi:Ca2+-binding RTX toxin-like protein
MIRNLNTPIAIAALLLPAAVGFAAPATASATAPEPPRCKGRPATIVGTDGDDFLRGTSRRDVIVARNGHDGVYAGGGKDLICGGGRADTLKGGPGDDVIVGGLGWDGIYGGAGTDRVLAGGGSDTLSGGPGDDRLLGQKDGCRAPFGVPDCRGDHSAGGRGDDTFDSDGFSWLFDTVDYSDAPHRVVANVAAGTVSGGGFHDRIRGDGRVRIIGSPASDDLTGSDQRDALEGGPGADELTGRAGGDRLEGQAGDDLLRGGAGNDDIDGGEGDDEANAGQGVDTCVDVEDASSCHQTP